MIPIYDKCCHLNIFQQIFLDKFYLSVGFQMKFYGSHIQSLQETFGIDILPEELGGKLPHGDILAQVNITMLTIIGVYFFLFVTINAHLLRVILALVVVYETQNMKSYMIFQFIF